MMATEMTEARLREIEAELRIECPDCGGREFGCLECSLSGTICRWPAGNDLITALRAAWQERDEAQIIVKQLQDFIARERAVRDSIGKGGQHTGTRPTINPSTLHTLERMIAHAPKTVVWLHEQMASLKAERDVLQRAAELQRCVLNAAYDDKVKAEAALTKANFVLREVVAWVDKGCPDGCPVCAGQDTHAHDCALAAVLAREGQ